MGRISVGRVIGGGLLAGLVINILELIVNGIWLAGEWEAAMRALGKDGANTTLRMVLFNAWGFAMGIMLLWVYAAIRPRFGPGARTARIAALLTWLLGYLMALIPPAALGMLPPRLMLAAAAVGFVEIQLGAQAGAYIYREDSVDSAEL